ncbi:MAG: helix-turn-helix transcriptional regulator [Alphaproteobacteria bacterium]|nr:helix-turn-helix transcriptional regulator [Alphaproteobacteria bacterium]
MTVTFSRTEMTILELLNTKPGCGWYAPELVEQSGGKLTMLGVYPALESLIQNGYVSEEEVPPENNNPTRLVRIKHHLTQDGRRIWASYQNCLTKPPGNFLASGWEPA